MSVGLKLPLDSVALYHATFSNEGILWRHVFVNYCLSETVTQENHATSTSTKIEAKTRRLACRHNKHHNNFLQTSERQWRHPNSNTESTDRKSTVPRTLPPIATPHLPTKEIHPKHPIKIQIARQVIEEISKYYSFSLLYPENDAMFRHNMIWLHPNFIVFDIDQWYLDYTRVGDDEQSSVCFFFFCDFVFRFSATVFQLEHAPFL